MSRTKDMCIIAKACNYNYLRAFKSWPEENAVYLKVRELKVKVMHLMDLTTTSFIKQSNRSISLL
jgi:hypothetical protein